MKRLILLVLIYLTIGIPVTLSEKRVFRVEVSVDCKDDTMESLIESYVKRELRSLGDVEVISTNPELQIVIAGMRDKTKGGRDLGYSLAVAYTMQHTVPFFVLRKDISHWMKAAYLSPVYEFSGLQVSGGSWEALQSTCQSVVASFDTGRLEPLRKMSQPLPQ